MALNLGAILQRRRRDDYVQTFTSLHGQRVFRDLVKFAGIGSGEDSSDHGGLAESYGMRRLILRIASFVNMDDKQLIETSLERDDA